MGSYRDSRDGTHIWVDLAAEAAAAKKGERIVILDVADVLSITDAFVIASATSDRHVRALADAVDETIRKAGGPHLLHTEGYSESRWILLDYGTFVVHIFTEETREYYNLERLWGDVPHYEYVDVPSEQPSYASAR